MTASRLVTRLGLLVSVAVLAVDPLIAQGPTSGADALRKAGVLERLARGLVISAHAWIYLASFASLAVQSFV